DGALAYAAVNFRRVVTCALREEARAMLNGATFRIGSAEIESTNAREGNRGGAHGARLERDIEIAIDQPLTANLGACFANGDELRVRGWILKLEGAVAGAGEKLSRRARNHCADRTLAAIARGLRLRQRQVHRRGLLASKRPICNTRGHDTENGTQ